MNKCKFVLLFFLCIMCNLSKAQDSTKNKRDSVHVNYIVNVIPDNYDRKLLQGLVNIAKGSHKGTHSAIFNWNQRSFKGLQLGIINYNGGNFKGAQVSFFNLFADTLRGLQISLFNIAKVNKGAQIALFSYVDTISGGASPSYIAIIRHGGYYAMEYFVSEMLPINFALKMGLSNYHGGFNFSFDEKLKTMFFGTSLCILKQISEKTYFNPEFVNQSAIGKKEKSLSLVSKFTYKLHKRIFVSAGPSFAWNYSKTKNLTTPYYALYDYNSANGKNKFVMGFRFGLRYNFTEVISKKSKKENG